MKNASILFALFLAFIPYLHRVLRDKSPSFAAATKPVNGLGCGADPTLIHKPLPALTA